MSVGISRHYEFNLVVADGLLQIGIHEESHPDWLPFHASLCNAITLSRLFPPPAFSADEYGFSIDIPAYFGFLFPALFFGIHSLAKRRMQRTPSEKSQTPY
jgi:hypothetical protein